MLNTKAIPFHFCRLFSPSNSTETEGGYENRISEKLSIGGTAENIPELDCCGVGTTMKTLKNH